MASAGEPLAASGGQGPAGAGLDAAARWRAERTEAAQAHAEALERRRQQAAATARAMLVDMVARATADGPAPVALRALDPDGRRSYRTPLRGWYLRRDGRVGVSTDAQYYVLVQAGGLLGTLRGVQPSPSDPPLVIGAGGRDGESIDLADAIARVLGAQAS
jgi:hypothetical protein